MNRSKNAFESDADGVSLSPHETADSTKQSIDLSTPKKVLKDTEPKTIDAHGHEHHEHLKGPQVSCAKVASRSSKTFRDGEIRWQLILHQPELFSRGV